MELNTCRKFKGDRLQSICFESDLLCPLGGTVHVSCHCFGRELHVYIRDIGHVLAVVVHFQCQLFALVACSTKSCLALVCVPCREMSDDETLRGGQFGIFLRKKAFVA